MNFVTFPVGSTNIFPQSNTHTGGQNVTEWSLRCREMVSTPSEIEYQVGPSYVHSENDFAIQVYQDSTGAILSSYTLEILPGQAVINGHYVETLTPMLVDLLEANTTLKAQMRAQLRGELAVGIRIFYSTEPTMNGTMLVENDQNMYLGVQIVILPKAELITPEDSPTDRSKITAHLRLGTFTYLNNSITGVISNTVEKLRYIPAERVKNADKLMSSNYITKSGLNPKKLYVFAGKGSDPSTGYDTWCDATDSLMVWDKNPTRTTDKPTIGEATFGTNLLGQVCLSVPHHQVDGMKDAEGRTEYYQPKTYKLPVADYSSGSSGTVDKAYTQHIKDITNKIEDFYQLTKGKQIGYRDVRLTTDSLPELNPAWSVGDYLLVGQDYTADEANDSVRPPVTMYAILPGQVKEITFHSKVTNSTAIPTSLTGIELSRIVNSAADKQSKPSETDPTKYPEFFSEDDGTRGIANKDYFVLKYINEDESYIMYYYVVSKSGANQWSSYLPVTGAIPFAQETVIGGFYNVSTDATDAGYVYRDDYGRLKLVDYALLRSGTLAYQIAEDYTIPSNITTEEIQMYLDEYINQRIAFPNSASSVSGLSVINVYLDLPAEETASVLNIHEIDSRFNTAMYLHITGAANSNTTINIYDCEKIRIDANIEGTPIINVYRSSIYYDPNVFNYIRSCDGSRVSFTGMQDISIWYDMFTSDDPNLLVDNMTVSELDTAIASNEVDYWSTSVLNDNHYMYALHSITFGKNGNIVECGIYISDQSTNNIVAGDKLVTGTFELPQGSALTYPISCLTKQLKITGTFVSAYTSDDTWIVTDTNFTALTDVYDEYSMQKTLKGSIAMHSHTTILEVPEVTSIPAWEPDSYHLFFGGALN